MKDADVQAIRDRLAKATGDRWVKGDYDAEERGVPIIAERADVPTGCTPTNGMVAWVGDFGAVKRDTNADLIAHAPDDLAALLDEREALRTTVAALTYSAQAHYPDGAGLRAMPSSPYSRRSANGLLLWLCRVPAGPAARGRDGGEEMSELVKPSDPANPPACPHGCDGGSPVCGLCADEGIWIDPVCRHGVSTWCDLCHLESIDALHTQVAEQQSEIARLTQERDEARSYSDGFQRAAEALTQERDTARAALADALDVLGSCRPYIAHTLDIDWLVAEIDAVFASLPQLSETPTQEPA